MTLIQLPIRSAEAHKGDFGHVLVIGGCESMPGAPALSGIAALRGGAGLVTVGTSREAHPITAGFSPCLMSIPLPSQAGLINATLDDLQSFLVQANVVAIGPGMGVSPALQQLVGQLYRTFPRPLVVDADGLNNLSTAAIDWSVHAGPRVLTPHPGEFQRMEAGYSGEPPFVSAVARDGAVEFAKRNQVVLVLKGHRTLVTDGEAVHFNTTGNSGMATAGTGDVLTGLIAALIGQHLVPLTAAATACHLHGLAGDFIAQNSSGRSLISQDLLSVLGQAFNQVESSR